MSRVNHNQQPLTWVLFGTSPWKNESSLKCHAFARWLVKRGHKVAFISSPDSPFASSSRDHIRAKVDPLGQWRHERLFTLTPRTWLPVLRRWPFGGNISWNGSEYFSRPQTGEIIREAGFANADVLVLSNFEMPHIVRHVDPRVFVVRIDAEVIGLKTIPLVIQRRYKELVRDADFVAVSDEDTKATVRQHGAHDVHVLKEDDSDLEGGFSAFEKRVRMQLKANVELIR